MRMLVLVGVLLQAATLLRPAVSRAQVTPSPTNSLTTGVVTTPSGLGGIQYDITGGTRPGGGPNLFHSFGGFSIGPTDVANFSNTMGPGIANVLGRVTGGAPSNISGQIQTSNFGSPPNLYLINPAGIMFGPDASVLNVGSLRVSTADYVRFPDAVRPDGTKVEVKFLATDSPLPSNGPITSSLTANPIAFGFLGPTAARISIEGSVLRVPEGQTLSVVGGDVQITGGPLGLLQAPSGRIAIASIGSPGEVPFNTSTQSPELDVRGFDRLGTIELSQQAFLDTSGVAGGGTVIIRGGDLVVDNSLILSNTLGGVPGATIGIDIDLTRDVVVRNNSGLQSATIGAGDAGNVLLSAGQDFVLSFGGIFTGSSGAGKAGDLVVATGRDVKINSSFIRTLSSDAGRSGNVTIRAGDYQQIAGGINTGTLAGGKAGDITINATRGAEISGTASRVAGLFAAALPTEGLPLPDGDGGSISISAPDLILDNMFIDTTTPGAGQAGSIVIRGAKLAVQNGTLLASGAFGTGPGGSASIHTTESITFSGGSGILNGTEGAGNAGGVSLRSPVVTLASEGLIETNAAGSGNGGPISIEADRVTLTDGFGLSSISSGTSSGTRVAGRGGNIAIRASESLVISTGSGARPSGIFTSTLGDGSSGDISITSPVVVLDGGNVVAFSADMLHQNNRGNAGNISFHVGELTLRNGGSVSAGTAGKTTAGAGGSVTIHASKRVDIDGTSDLGASILNGVEGSSAAGPVTIRTPTLVVSGRSGFIESNTLGAGAGGVIDIDVAELRLQDGGAIASGSDGAGPGGTIRVRATEALTISGDGGLFTGSLRQGQSGDIDVAATHVSLTNGAQISAKSKGEGNAGSVQIVIGDRLRMVGSKITTEALAAAGGNISLTTTGSLLHLTDSQITTSVQGGEGGGGDITIGSGLHPLDFVVLNNSGIHANAFGGPGGEIQVIAGSLLSSLPTEIAITATSERSVAGTITIQADVTDVSGSLARLPAALLEAAALLRASCAARLAGGKTSTLVVAGREGLPLEPGGLLPSPLLAEGPPGGGLSGSAEPQWEQVAAERYRLVTPSAVLDSRCSR